MKYLQAPNGIPLGALFLLHYIATCFKSFSMELVPQ